ncbi:uncharacterized protein DUF397 [Actinomadura hallensis]|uniref:Uncharacterized protein DUF397 n=1 Tax=Actinomadura hallensis TaxID=337895 RepID=A0A543I7X8_9ACTN|nr:DUF397 domain-containing protein [Actinomadura hallensis]TQM66696.1 uncharacterized protein DUF397 [Actinomadura hallensis]
MGLTDATWRKASGSSEQGDACIELAFNVSIVAVRDSKDPNGPQIVITRDEFRQFANALKSL